MLITSLSDLSFKGTLMWFMALGTRGRLSPASSGPLPRRTKRPVKANRREGGVAASSGPARRSAPSSAPSSPDTPSSPTRIQSAASPSSPKTAPSAQWCPWTARLASGTTSRCWPQSSVRSPGPPGEGEGSGSLAEELSLSRERGGSHCPRWLPSLDHHHQAGLLVSEVGLAWIQWICLRIPLTLNSLTYLTFPNWETNPTSNSS